jgi:hypothetical protein
VHFYNEQAKAKREELMQKYGSWRKNRFAWKKKELDRKLQD